MSVQSPRLSLQFSAVVWAGVLASSVLTGACGADSPSGDSTNGGAASGAAATPTAGSGGTVVTPQGGIANGTAGTAGVGTATSGSGSGGANASGSGNGGALSGGAAGAATAGSGGTAPAAGATGSGGSGGTTPVSCPATVLAAGNSNKTIQVGGGNRTYVLHVPAGYDGKKAVPLVIDFHPLGGSGPNEATGSPYPSKTDADGVIMAFPSGKSGPSGGAWNVGPCCVKDTDDVAFAKALVSEIEKSACIDPKRVYAVGFSMGGGMSHYLACHASDVFAAVAPAAFDLLKENVDDCKPTRPISVVSFRSTADPIVPYAGGASSVVSGMPVTFLGAKATFEKWGALNQCSGAASAEDAQGCSRFSSCQGGVDVVLCTKQGGGHEAGNAGVAWPILKQHTLP